LLLVIMILAAVMPPNTQARHLRDKVALDYAYDEDNSGRSSSSSAGDILPAFDVNPYRGLAESFGEGSYDSDLSLSESSYEEIAQAAIRAARREMRRQRTRHARSHNLRLFASKSDVPEWENPCGGTYTADESLSDSSASQGRVIKRKVSRGASFKGGSTWGIPSDIEGFRVQLLNQSSQRVLSLRQEALLIVSPFPSSHCSTSKTCGTSR